MDNATRAEIPQASADEVFLSPRVVDQVAFEEYGRQLRSLVDALSENAGSLHTSLREAASVRAALETVTSEDRERLASASELLTKLDERATRIEAALAKADKLDEIGKTFEGEADRLLGSRVSELEKRMAQSIASFSRQLQTQLDAHNSESKVLLAKLQTGREQMDQHIEQKVSRTLNALREQCDKAEYLAGRRESGSAKAATGSLAQMIERASEVQLHAKEAIALLDDADEQTNDLHSRIASAIDSASSLVETLTSATDTAQEARASLTLDVDRASRAQRSMETESKRAEGLARKVALHTKEAKKAEGLLADSRKMAKASSNELRDALASLEPWRKVLLEPTSQAKLPEPIAELVREMRAELGTDLLTMTEAMKQVALGARAPQPAPKKRSKRQHAVPEIVICTSNPPPVPAWGAD